ncbi:MAG TPA: OmpA family protein [Leptolinea sp.]
MSHGGGGDRWLVSYSDFITLLMVLFVVLYSMGQTDMKRYKALAQNLKAAFTVGGAPPKVVDPQIDQTGGLNSQAAAQPITIDGMPVMSSTDNEVAGKLTDLLKANGLGSEVSIQNNVEGVLISLSQSLTFVEGRAELQPSAYPVLDTIASMLVGVDNEVRVIGHTDNSRPADPKYADNWELSMARANEIVRYFQTKGVTPDRLIPSGRGEFQPVFPNDSPEHRSLNSRAEIIVIYPISSDAIHLDMRNLLSDTSTSSASVPTLEVKPK